MIKKNFLIATLLLCCAFSFAQYPAKYWIEFKDKNNNDFDISRPEFFLSQRALDKRAKYNIKITQTDLPVSNYYVRQILELDPSIFVVTRSKWMNGITIYCEDPGIIEKLIKLPFVKNVEKTITLKTLEKAPETKFFYSTGNDMAYKPKSLPSCDFKYGQAEKQIRVNNAQWLHRLGFQGEGMLIMVLDGGFINCDSIKHFKQLREEHRLWGVVNFVSPEENPMRKNTHSGTHGTAVLSFISSNIPDEDIGSAPKSSIFLLQTEDIASENKIEEDNWIAGLEFADSLGCDIVNTSLGYTKFDDTLCSHTPADLNGQTSRSSIAAAKAAERGLVVCIAAGNEGSGKWKYLGIPSDADNIITVGALTYTKTRAPFSSYNAPANPKTKPDAAAVGYMAKGANEKGKTVSISGTSVACPLITGMVSCLWQSAPDKNSFDVIKAVQESGANYNSPDNSLGYGCTDFWRAYNLLKSPSVTSVNGEKIISVDISNFVINNNQLIISIHSEIVQKIKVDIKPYSQNFEEKDFSKLFNLKKGNNTIKVKKFYKLNDNSEYGFLTLTITGENLFYNYLLAIEK